MAHAQIEDLECTLYLDYDCRSGALKRLSDDGKVAWLEKRMQMIFMGPLEKIHDEHSTAFKDLHDPEGSPPITPLFLTTSAIMNGIEDLGSFLITPKKRRKLGPNQSRFIKFIELYMPRWTVVVNAPHFRRMRLSRILWKAFRNGLAHGFAIDHAALEGQPPAQLYQVKDGLIQIDPFTLFHDFRSATSEMFLDVRSNPRMRRSFLARFRELYGCK